MLLRFDPFRDLDRLAGEMLGASRVPQAMPMDVYRSGDHFVLHFDLPGIDPGSMDVTTENNTLTVRAERTGAGPEDAEYLVSERPRGSFNRQLVLGDGLDLERIEASYRDGVLTLTIPVAEVAKPRRVQIAHQGESAELGGAEHRVIAGEASGA